MARTIGAFQIFLVFSVTFHEKIGGIREELSLSSNLQLLHADGVEKHLHV